MDTRYVGTGGTLLPGIGFPPPVASGLAGDGDVGCCDGDGGTEEGVVGCPGGLLGTGAAPAVPVGFTGPKLCTEVVDPRLGVIEVEGVAPEEPEGKEEPDGRALPVPAGLLGLDAISAVEPEGCGFKGLAKGGEDEGAPGVVDLVGDVGDCLCGAAPAVPDGSTEGADEGVPELDKIGDVSEEVGCIPLSAAGVLNEASVVVKAVVVLHIVIVVLHVVQGTLSGNACATTAFRSSDMLSNPFPITALAPAIIEFALATSEAAIA